MYQSVTELDNMNLQRESVWNRQEKPRYKMDSIFLVARTGVEPVLLP